MMRGFWPIHTDKPTLHCHKISNLICIPRLRLMCTNFLSTWQLIHFGIKHMTVHDVIEHNNFWNSERLDKIQSLKYPIDIWISGYARVNFSFTLMLVLYKTEKEVIKYPMQEYPDIQISKREYLPNDDSEHFSKVFHVVHTSSRLIRYFASCVGTFSWMHNL